MTQRSPRPSVPPKRSSVPWLKAIPAVLALWGPATQAGDFSLGLGLGFDRGRTDCIAGYPCDHASAHGKLFGTYALDPNVDVQLLYVDAGRFRGGDATPQGTAFGGDFHVSGFGLSGGYRWALAPAWSLTARAGVASVRTGFDYAAPFAGSVSQTTTQPLIGLGISYAAGPEWRWGIDLDATRFRVYQTRGALQLLSLSAQYSF